MVHAVTAEELEAKIADAKETGALATAALIEITGLARKLDGAIIRGEGGEAQEVIRQNARDTLEVYLDMTAEAATKMMLLQKQAGL